MVLIHCRPRSPRSRSVRSASIPSIHSPERPLPEASPKLFSGCWQTADINRLILGIPLGRRGLAAQVDHKSESRWRDNGFSAGRGRVQLPRDPLSKRIADLVFRLGVQVPSADQIPSARGGGGGGRSPLLM